MKQTKHKPGVVGKRTFSNYNDFQNALWQAFDDFYHADVGGYGAMRMPTPGKPLISPIVDQLAFKEWQQLVITRWKAEAHRDVHTRGCTVEEFPDNLWYYLYERFLVATNEHHVYFGKSSSSS